MKLMLALLIFIYSRCLADDLIISLGSYHTAYRNELRKSDMLNEFNPGIGWQNSKFAIGIHENSKGIGSAYAAKKWNHGAYFSFAGVVTGHSNDHPILPFIGLGVDTEYFQFSVFPGMARTEGTWKTLIVLGVSARIRI